MELVYLHTFREIARWGSFTRAAEELGYAQPTVTAQMQKLEHSYGAPLFERFGRKLRLTQAGEVLLPYAQELIRLYGESKEVVSRQLSGPVRIGTIDTLAAFSYRLTCSVFGKQSLRSISSCRQGVKLPFYSKSRKGSWI